MSDRPVARGRWRELLARLEPYQVLAIGFAVFVVYAFPGYMSNDSAMQLSEARSAMFSNAHPALMAAEWRILDAIVAGPILMLLLQGALFLGGLHVLLRRSMSERCAAWLAIAVLLFPPVLTTMATIWKDAQMAAYLIAATAALLSPSRRVRLAGLALATIGCAMRYNAFGASVPLVGLLFVLAPDRRGWRRYAVSGAAAVASVALAFGVDSALTVQHMYLAPTMADIAGVLAHTGDRSDDALRQTLAGTPLHVTSNIQDAARAHYSARNAYWVNHGDDRLFDPPTTAAEEHALAGAWKRVVLGDPRAYLAYRLDGFEELLGLSSDPLWSPVWRMFLENPQQATQLGHDASPSYVQQHLGDALEWLADDTPLFRPYVYALIALGLLVLALRARDRTAIALLTSGLLYELSYFPAAGTPDFRYSQWLIACTCIAGVLAVVRRRAKAKAPA